MVGLLCWPNIVHATDAPVLDVPLQCSLGQNCFVQNYMDEDSGAGVRDFACGQETYDGHKGTDFRLLNTQATDPPVPVRAAAAGVVTAVRDEMPDTLYRPGEDATIKNRECGNGVVLDHGAGWVTQYCHMQRGSIAVHVGQMVTAGAVLGHVGFSGQAAFAHLHFELRHNGRPINPYTGRGFDTVCNSAADMKASLWSQAAQTLLAYQTGQIIEAGFSGQQPKLDKLEEKAPEQPSATDQALLFYARSMHLQANDRIHLVIRWPDQSTQTFTSDPLPKAKATHLFFGGKKLRAERWPAGIYEGTASILRGDQEFGSTTVHLTLPQAAPQTR